MSGLEKMRNPTAMNTKIITIYGLYSKTYRSNNSRQNDINSNRNNKS